MPLRQLTDLPESELASLNDIELSMLEHIFDNWAQFEQPMQLRNLSNLHRQRKYAKARGGGAYIKKALDRLAEKGYITSHRNYKGGQFYFPFGIWKLLPPHMKETLKKPSARNLKAFYEIEDVRMKRLLAAEQDYDRDGELIEVAFRAPAQKEQNEHDTNEPECRTRSTGQDQLSSEASPRISQSGEQRAPRIAFTTALEDSNKGTDRK